MPSGEQSWSKSPEVRSSSGDETRGDMLSGFAETVARMPDAPAAFYFGRTFSFAELDRLSDAFARSLVWRGLKPGDRFAIHLQNVPQFPIALLGVWKAGGVAVAASPMLTSGEVETLLDDSGAIGIITLESLWHASARDAVERSGTKIEFTTSELDFLDPDASAEFPGPLSGSRRLECAGTIPLVEELNSIEGSWAGRASPDPDDLAVLTYTSGTTGPSKGAMSLQRNIAFNADTYRRWMSIDENDVILAVAPLFHVTGLVAHMAIGMISGAPLVLTYRFDADEMLDAIERHRVTFTVGAITAFVALGAVQESDPRDVSSLSKVMSGGAPIPPSLADRFEARFGTYLHNNYGLTETNSPSHMVPRDTRAPVDPETGALSVGVPVYDTEVKVLDEDGRSLPVGEQGELAISGPQVVPGYWQRPEETAKAFSDGFLRTGDVGFEDSEGWFYLVDRIKDQINVSGFKVWPREVEDALVAHPDVVEAAVVGVEDSYRGETVKAFVTVRSGSGVDAETLIDFGRQQLASYKAPRQVEIVKSLPRTASGKILRRELRDA